MGNEHTLVLYEDWEGAKQYKIIIKRSDFEEWLVNMDDAITFISSTSISENTCKELLTQGWIGGHSVSL